MRLLRYLFLVAGILFVELATAAESGYDSPDRENRNRTVLLVARIPYDQLGLLPPTQPGRILVLVIDHPDEANTNGDQPGYPEREDTQSSRTPSSPPSSRHRGSSFATDVTKRHTSPNTGSGSGPNSFSNVNPSGYTSNYGGSRTKPPVASETPSSSSQPTRNTETQYEPVPTIETATSYIDSNGDQYSYFPSDGSLNKRLNYPQIPATTVNPSDRPSDGSTQTNYNPTITPSTNSNRRQSDQSSYGNSQTNYNPSITPSTNSNRRESDQPSYGNSQTNYNPSVTPSTNSNRRESDQSSYGDSQANYNPSITPSTNSNRRESDQSSYGNSQTKYNPSVKPSTSSNRHIPDESSYGSAQTNYSRPTTHNTYPNRDNSDQFSHGSPQTPEATPLGPKFSYQASTNEFGINLMKQLINQNENTFISPLPLGNALGMLYFAAAGNTKAQLGRLLNYNTPGLDDRKVLASIKKSFEVTAKSRKLFQIEFVNYIFAQKGLNVTEDFKTTVRNNFVAVIEDVDFLNKPREALRRINKRITEGTKGFIKDPVSSVEPNSLLMLVNAIYFKGSWQEPFAAEATFDSTFANDGFREVPVRMMHMQNYFRIKSLPEIEAEAIQIPYKGGDVIMLIILPNNKTGVDHMLEQMDIGKIVQDLSGYKNVTVDLYVPRFEVTGKYKLKRQLAELGVTDMFISGRAELPGLDNNKNAVASDVIHEVKVLVDEIGTEAAAVTTVPLFKRSATDLFAVKHPFVFMILNKRSKTVFFMGKVLRMPTVEFATEPVARRG